MSCYFYVTFNGILLLFTAFFFAYHSKWKLFHIMSFVSMIYFLFFIVPYFFGTLRNYFLTNYGSHLICISQLDILLSFILLMIGYKTSVSFIKSHSVSRLGTPFKRQNLDVIFEVKKIYFFLFLCFSLVCFFLLMRFIPGGFIFYINNAGTISYYLAGKIYFIVGIIAIKFAFFVCLLSAIQSRKPPLYKFFLWFFFLFSTGIITLFGRLYGGIFILQVIVLLFAESGFSFKFKSLYLYIFAILCIVLIVFVYGQYRIMTASSLHKPVISSNFTESLKYSEKPFLRITFLNYLGYNYIFLRFLKARVQVDGGMQYLKLLLVPIPRYFRAKLEGTSMRQEMNTVGFGFGMVTPLIVEAILNFGIPGLFIFSIFGFLLGVLQISLLNSSNFKKLFLGCIIYPHIFSILRAGIGMIYWLFVDMGYAYLVIKFVLKEKKYLKIQKTSIHENSN